MTSIVGTLITQYISALSTVATTPYGQRNPSWASQAWNEPQMILALALIELTPKGKQWGAQLAQIPGGTRASDPRYSEECGAKALVEAEACVEWFFNRSGLSADSPMVQINWHNPSSMSTYPGIGFSCNAVQRMLYAVEVDLATNYGATSLISQLKQRTDALENIVLRNAGSTEQLIKDVEKRLSALETQRNAIPAVTCLMRLFEETELQVPSHTDRMLLLPSDARNWLLQELASRPVYVHATDENSDTNHIAWQAFEGSKKMNTDVVFQYGNYRFWQCRNSD
ncbi:hypothetical protein BDZ91DRAFT_778647 [Kalaharituber pfeilii]|nr:hypothetical protein BDZ91DRAFT_778647 [Kalaharituber pfeilii]